jgi:hypothetical protein
LEENIASIFEEQAKQGISKQQTEIVQPAAYLC